MKKIIELALKPIKDKLKFIVKDFTIHTSIFTITIIVMIVIIYLIRNY